MRTSRALSKPQETLEHTGPGPGNIIKIVGDAESILPLPTISVVLALIARWVAKSLRLRLRGTGEIVRSLDKATAVVSWANNAAGKQEPNNQKKTFHRGNSLFTV